MPDKTAELAGLITDAMKHSSEKKTEPYDTTAVVTRIEKKEDGTKQTWVSIPGGVRETPVRTGVAMKPGDEVQVHVGGGRAIAQGNYTSPPTDDTRANQAYSVGADAMIAAERADLYAQEAQESAEKAHDAADEADKFAHQAWTKAGEASDSAVSAQNSAYKALFELSTVEDVVDTLNWITAHGTMSPTGDYELTQDTSLKKVYEEVENPSGNPSEQGWYELVDDEYVLTQDIRVIAGKTYYSQEDKKYYERTGQGSEEDPYVYTEVTPTGDEDPSQEGWYEGLLNPSHVYYVLDPNGEYEIGGVKYTLVSNPKVKDINTYYELDVLDSINNYLTTHVSVTNNGMNLQLDSNNYRIHIGTLVTGGASGVYILDPNDNKVGFYGENSIVGNEKGVHITLGTDNYSSRYKEVENPIGNPSQQGWYELVDGEYVLTQDTTVVSGKTYYFLDPDSTYGKPVLGLWQSETSRVAYISSDELYINRTVVLNTMRLGDWLWRVNETTKNLSLYWIG